MIPDELKMRLYYRAVESIAKTAEDVFDDRKIGNRIRRLGNDQLKPAIEESLAQVLERYNIGADDTGLMGVAERLISSRPFQDALENVLLQPWRVTDETFHRLNEIAAAEVGTEEAQLVTSMMGVILQNVARDLWRIREVRETYAVYFQERLVELGLEQVNANRQTQELLKDIRNGERGLARGEYVLAEAEERRAIEAGATGLATDESLAQDLVGQQLRRRAPGSRSLRMRDVVADGLFQVAGAVDWADPQALPRPALPLLSELTQSSEGAPILLLGDGGIGKTTTALAYASARVRAGQQVVFIDMSQFRGGLNDPDIGSRAWLEANVAEPVRPLIGDAVLVLDSVDELFSGLPYTRVAELCDRWWFSSAVLVCCRRSFYDRVLTWTDLAQRCETVELAPWDLGMIEEYARVFLARTRPSSAAGLLDTLRARLRQDRRLAELCAIPLRLSMLLELREPFASVSEPEGALRRLYGTYISEYLRYESARFGSLLPGMEKADLLEAVAWEFFDEHSHGYGDERNFTLKEVSDFLDRCKIVLQKGPGARDDIIFRTLLRLRDSDTLATNGAISFQHKSFQEFFVARRIYSRMLRGNIDGLVETFGRLFSPEVSEFLKEFLVEVNGSPRLQQSSYMRLSAAFASATAEGGPHDRIRIARQQLGYYLGNVRHARAHQWLKEALADESDPWVRRGIAVGLAFGGDLDALDEYIDELRSELDGDDRRENAVNLGFHLTFFGDQPVDVESPETDQGGESCAKTVEGLVYQLGTETDRPSWRLNLYTLWFLVTQARAELRESAGQRLRDLGGTAPELVQQLLRDPAASQWPETQAVGNLVARLSR